MSEAPANALVLTSECPICQKDTITCRFWSTRLEWGGFEGQSEEERTCKCPMDEVGYMHLADGYMINLTDICAAEYDAHILAELSEEPELFHVSIERLWPKFKAGIAYLAGRDRGR